MTIISIPAQNTRYFKIVQTGNTKTNYWSIHEAYVINDDYEDAIIKTSQKNQDAFCANGNLCLKGFSGKSRNKYISVEWRKNIYLPIREFPNTNSLRTWCLYYSYQQSER